MCFKHLFDKIDNLFAWLLLEGKVVAHSEEKIYIDG